MKRGRKHRKDLNGHVSINKIHGHYYLYFHYSDEEGRERTEYVGPVNLESHVKAKERQISYLEEIKAGLNLRMGELRGELARLEQQRKIARSISDDLSEKN